VEPGENPKPKRTPALSVETRGLLIIAFVLFLLYLFGYLNLSNWSWHW
jgi:hypothetical protein